MCSPQPLLPLPLLPLLPLLRLLDGTLVAQHLDVLALVQSRLRDLPTYRQGTKSRINKGKVRIIRINEGSPWPSCILVTCRHAALFAVASEGTTSAGPAGLQLAYWESRLFGIVSQYTDTIQDLGRAPPTASCPQADESGACDEPSMCRLTTTSKVSNPFKILV